MILPDTRRFPGTRVVAVSLLWGLLWAGVLTLIGNGDLENYDHTFVSLNRGTRMQVDTLAGQPVYTLALGLGVRLPLLGNLSASPAAVVSPYVPEPITYWLLFTFAIGASTLLLHLALSEMCDRLLSWCAAFLIVWSMPVVYYTLVNDWPETAITYWATVGAVFAPHALLAVWNTSATASRRTAAGVGVLGLVWSLIAAAHPGYWPTIGASLAASALLALFRDAPRLQSRLVAVALLGICSATVVALLAPDVLREIAVAREPGGALGRMVRGPEGDLWAANIGQAFSGPWRRPFTMLLLALVSAVAAMRDGHPVRRRIVAGSAGLSAVFGLAASMPPVAPQAYTPSAVWAFRDPAIAFAVFSACGAATTLLTATPRSAVTRLLTLALVLAAAQGPLIVAPLFLRVPTLRALTDSYVAPRGWSAPASRAALRGLSPDAVAPGSRIAFWTTVTSRSRNARQSQVDFVDAGYELVTATTKQRTMRGVILGHNNVLFEQSTNLPSETLCSPAAVRLLQIHYLLAPPGSACGPWRTTAFTPVDKWLDVYRAEALDTRLHAVPSAAVTEALRRTPIFESDSALLSLVQPKDGTAVSVGARQVTLRWEQPPIGDGLTYLLPLAYDPALRVSSGRTANVGGLLAVIDVDRPDATVSFVPDLSSQLRVLAVVLAQISGIVGLIGVALVAPAASPQLAGRIAAALRPTLEWMGRTARRVDALSALYAGAVLAPLALRQSSERFDRGVAALLFLAVVFVTARVPGAGALREWWGRAVLAGAVAAVAIRGSGAYDAAHDPLFWALLAGLALVVSLAPPRLRGLALVAAAVAGGAAAWAQLLMRFPYAAANLGNLRASIGEAAAEFTDSLGVAAAMLLVALWLRAGLGIGRGAWKAVSPVMMMGRAALIVWLVACAAGAMPDDLGIAWFAVLGVVAGFARPAPASRVADDAARPTAVREGP